MNPKIINKVQDFLIKEIRSLEDVAIFKNEDGSYTLFDKYNIQKNSDHYLVITRSEELSFSTLKNAVTWCVFENRKKYMTSNRIKHLDQLISSSKVAIEIQRNILKRVKGIEDMLIHSAKLHEEELKKNTMLQEIEGYIQESIYWQTKKFSSKDK